jgi:hypothetical protein
VEQAEVGRRVSHAPWLARRNHECIGWANGMIATVIEARGTVEDEAEHQLALVRGEGQG